jgi:3-oxoacyl-[acyl-carrier protein] reductase
MHPRHPVQDAPHDPPAQASYPSLPSLPGAIVRVPAEAEAVDEFLEGLNEETQPKSLNYGMSMRGRTAIVTGGATGIGRAIALEFARHGVNVAFNWYSYDGGVGMEEEAEQTERDLRQMEVRVHCEPCDVRDSDAVNQFVRNVQEEFGRVHFLVNNAGIARDRALWRLTDDQWSSVLDTNLTGAFHMIRALAPTFRRHHDGKIVNVSSVHGIRSEFGLANYSASKAGLLGLTRSAALELGPSNVNVNAVAPGYIRTTRLTNGVPAEILDTARERSVLGRLGDPQDVANVVVFLCSEYARHITGTVIPVDGGHLL